MASLEDFSDEMWTNKCSLERKIKRNIKKISKTNDNAEIMLLENSNNGLRKELSKADYWLNQIGFAPSPDAIDALWLLEEEIEARQDKKAITIKVDVKVRY